MKQFVDKILASLIILSLFNCGNPQKEAVAEAGSTTNGNSIVLTKVQFDQAGMQFGKLQEKNFPMTISANGMIDVPPENRAVVSATMGGYIKTSPLLIGDRVKKGQALVTIENPEFVAIQQQYLEVKERLTYLRSEYERQKTLFEENITSEKNYLQTESQFKTAQATYNGLRKQLSMLHISATDVESGKLTETATIYSPISGSITKVNVSLGTFVSPATPILEIIDNDHVHIELSVFEKDIMKLKKEQAVLFKIPEASTATFEGEVHLIGTSIDETRTIKVHAHPKDRDSHNFLVGMYVEARIVTDIVTAMGVPTDALVNIDNAHFLLVLKSENGDGYVFEQVEVQIGDSFEGFTIVKNPETLESATQILTKGAYELLGE
tara:strand:- start:658 stop:1797 length:1140 start_codon:yes stop_codon:yes gene_type:complete